MDARSVLLVQATQGPLLVWSRTLGMSSHRAEILSDFCSPCRHHAWPIIFNEYLLEK